MTVETPTEVQVQTGLNSCYRAGWPTPEEFVKGVAPYEDESKADYVTRIKMMGEVHNQRMTKIVIEGLQTDGGLHRVFRLGKLARKNLTKALYILGYSEEA